MKKNKVEIRLILAVILSSLLVLFGVFCIYSGFEQAAEDISAEYSDHLLDTVKVIDWNVDSMLSGSREQLRQMIKACVEPAEEFFITRDSSELQEAMSSHAAMTAPYADSAALIYLGTVLASTSGENLDTYSFPDGIGFERPCICIYKGEKKLLALVERCVDSDYRYALFIDPAKFYQQCLQSDLAARYRLSFYDMGSGLFMENSGLQPEVKTIPVHEAEAQNDGLSLFVSAEKDGGILIRRIELEGLGERIIAVLPTGSNRNGIFTVGLSQSDSGFMNMLSRVFIRIMAGSVIIFLSIFTLLLMYLNNRRTNAVMREKVELLKKENETMQELAHHQRLEMIGTMTGSLAHEFNNMLTPIMGYSVMTMEQLPEGCDELMDNLSEILDSAEKAKSLISRMSALTRKNTEAANRLLSPDALVQRVRHITAPSLPANVEVILDCGCPDCVLFANETQMTQLLMNIVINAFQAMEDQGGTLTVSTRLEDDNVVFRLADTGPGIPEDVLARMFEPFFTTKEVGRGTGLGLAIATQIAETHNGSIRAESEPGKGTVFTVTLPAGRE